MSKSSLKVFLAVAFLLIGSAAAVTEVAMVMAKQRSPPAHFVRTALEHPNVLKGARLNNDSGKAIASYRIGWANVYPNAIELRRGSLVTVRRRIKPGDTHDVPDQAIPFNERPKCHFLCRGSNLCGWQQLGGRHQGHRPRGWERACLR